MDVGPAGVELSTTRMITHAQPTEPPVCSVSLDIEIGTFVIRRSLIF